mgnify:CR=1 FL=1
MKTESGINTRALVLDILLEMEKGQEYGSLLLKNVLDKYDYLESRDKAFIKRLTEGVTERRIQLDYVLGRFSKTPPAKCKPLIRNLLRMGAYQILFMDNVPDSAACNEAVKLAEKRHFQQLKGFVNGVLRSLSREKEKLVWPDKKKEPVLWLSVMYSMPEWIVRMWLADYGPETTEKILAGLLEPRPVTIRLAERLTEEERKELLARLEECGASPAAHPYLPYAYMLQKSDGVASLPGFAQGMFAVQDVSSMLVTECALDAAQKTDFLLDVIIIFRSKTGNEILNGNSGIGGTLTFQFFQLLVSGADIEAVKDGPVQIYSSIQSLVVYTTEFGGFTRCPCLRIAVVCISGISGSQIHRGQVAGIS